MPPLSRGALFLFCFCTNKSMIFWSGRLLRSWRAWDSRPGRLLRSSGQAYASSRVALCHAGCHSRCVPRFITRTARSVRRFPHKMRALGMRHAGTTDCRNPRVRSARRRQRDTRDQKRVLRECNIAAVERKTRRRRGARRGGGPELGPPPGPPRRAARRHAPR